MEKTGRLAAGVNILLAQPIVLGQYFLGCGAVSEQAQAGDMLAQTITTTLRLTRTDAHGGVVEQGESRWASRYLFRYEAVHLLCRCGFEVVSLVGNYRDGPLTEGGQLIFEVRLGESDAGRWL
jgi:hypothetical protein